jgi:hypothetical protein
MIPTDEKLDEWMSNTDLYQTEGFTVRDHHDIIMELISAVRELKREEKENAKKWFYKGWTSGQTKTFEEYWEEALK